MRKVLLLLKLVIKYRNLSLMIYINPPDYSFQYIVQESNNYFHRNDGRWWISDEGELTEMRIEK